MHIMNIYIKDNVEPPHRCLIQGLLVLLFLGSKKLNNYFVLNNCESNARLGSSLLGAFKRVLRFFLYILSIFAM